MSEINIERWIDLDGADFKRVAKPTFTRKIIQIGIDGGVIKVDNAGYMWQNGAPVYAELDGKFVGLRFSAKAAN
jgi:hypothetical protein